MQKKGTILIVDDRIDEKIGSFSEHLTKDGFNVEIAGTYEDAEKALKALINNNTLDGIILDFSFPVNGEDPSVSTNGTPNGVLLLKNHMFKINLKKIPVVINTTGDEDYKKKYLGSLGNLEMPVYNVNHQANPLARPSIRMVKDIIDMFNQRCEQRKIKPDNSWNKTGTSIVYDPKKGYSYNPYRDGD